MHTDWRPAPDSGGKVLLSRNEADAADEERRKRRLPPHHQPAKIWEGMTALDIISREGDERSSKIVDLGARYGVILPWLAKSGFRNLWGCDLTYPFPPLRAWLFGGNLRAAAQTIGWIVSKRLKLSRQDMSDLGYPDASFDFVTCLSVIEHVADPSAALKEMRRILKPGGTALISTDYWDGLVDTSGIDICGQPARVYDKETLQADLIEAARESGLELVGPVDLDVDETVVQYDRMNYTFVFFQFRASAG